MKQFLFFIAFCTFFVLNAQEREIQWFYQLSSHKTTEVRNVKVDKNRNILICQTFEGPVDLDFGPRKNLLYPFNGKDLLITKLDSNGKVLWNVHVKGSYDEHSVGLVLDDSLNSYVYGNFAGSIQFDSKGVSNLVYSNGDSRDIFLAKYDSEGKFLWAKQIGNVYSSDRAMSVSVVNNNIYLLGAFERTFTFDGEKHTDTLISDDGEQPFLARLDLHGNLQWLKHIEGKSDVLSYAMDADNDGNIYIGYHFSVEVYIFSGWKRTIKAKGSRDFIIQKLDKQGNNIWYRHYSDGGYDNINDIRVDKSGENLYVVGTFQQTMNFNPSSGSAENLTSILGNDGFLLKLSTAGQFGWVRQFGTTRSDWLGHVTLFTDSSVAICGQLREDFKTIDFKGDTVALENNGAGDAFVVEVSNNGGVLWMGGLGGRGEEMALEVEPDNFGNLFVVGTFTNAISYETNGKTTTWETPTNFSDGYLLKWGFPNRIVVDTMPNDSSLSLGFICLKGENLLMYPNPMHNLLKVDFFEKHKTVQLVIRDNLGRIHLKRSYANSRKIELAHSLKPGLYRVSVIIDDNEPIERLIIQK